MEYTDWDLLYVLQEEKSIRKASERLYISQPSITYRLHQLEKEFDAPLFFRSSKGVELTPQGETLFQYSKDMKQKLSELKEHIKTMSGKNLGTLRIGAFPIVANYELPALLKAFTDRYPAVKVIIRTGLSYKIMQMLSSEEIHLGVIRGEYEGPGPKLLLKEEPLSLASCHPIQLSSLPSLPLVRYVTNSSLNNLIDDWWYERFSQPPKILMEVDNINTCVKMIASDLGYSFLPAECLSELTLHVQNLYKLDGAPVTRKTWLLYRNSVLKNPEVEMFIDLVKTTFAIE